MSMQWIAARFQCEASPTPDNRSGVVESCLDVGVRLVAAYSRTGDGGPPAAGKPGKTRMGSIKPILTSSRIQALAITSKYPLLLKKTEK